LAFDRRFGKIEIGRFFSKKALFGLNKGKKALVISFLSLSMEF